MSEELKNDQSSAEATTEAKAPRYANALFPHACVHEPYTNSQGIRRTWVDLPAHTELNGQDMTGYRINVRMQPWMEEQYANGDDVRIGFNEKYEVKAFKGRGDDAQEVVVKPWDLAKGVKAAREAGHIAAYDYMKFSVPAESVHPYERTTNDGMVFKKAIVDLPNGYKVDVFMRPWMMEQKEAGQSVQLSFEAGKDVELFQGAGSNRTTMTIDPSALRAEVIAAVKQQEAAEPKEAKPREKTSFKERAEEAKQVASAMEKAEKTAPEKSLSAEIGA